MNWSITTWAPLAKSPNWASQMVQRVRVGQREAVLEAQHRLFRQRRVRAPRSGPGRGAGCAAGCSVSSVVWSMMPAWRWVKVPRTQSWPDRRTGIALVQQGGEGQVLGRWPSRCPRPSSMASRRPSITRSTVLWTLIRSGMVVILWPRSSSFCLGDAGDAALLARRAASGPTTCRPASRPCRRGRSCRRRTPRRGRRRTRRSSRRPRPAWRRPRRPAARRRARGRVGWSLIFAYIKGWVIVGSSPSLWPNRR